MSLWEDGVFQSEFEKESYQVILCSWCTSIWSDYCVCLWYPRSLQRYPVILGLLCFCMIHKTGQNPLLLFYIYFYDFSQPYTTLLCWLDTKAYAVVVSFGACVQKNLILKVHSYKISKSPYSYITKVYFWSRLQCDRFLNRRLLICTIE